MTEEQALAQATEETELLKPLNKVVNGVVTEFSEEDYNNFINDKKNIILDEYNNGYKRARESAYLPYAEQLDMMYWDSVNGTTNWQDHIAEVKANNPKP